MVFSSILGPSTNAGPKAPSRVPGAPSRVPGTPITLQKLEGGICSIAKTSTIRYLTFPNNVLEYLWIFYIWQNLWLYLWNMSKHYMCHSDFNVIIIWIPGIYLHTYPRIYIVSSESDTLLILWCILSKLCIVWK